MNYSFNNSELEIVFKFGKCEDRHMSVEIEYENDAIAVRPTDGYASYKKSIQLPTSIKIRTFGKGIDDTKLDENGNIFEDMFVQIESISLDSFKLSDIYLHQKVSSITESGQEVISSYLGFNGETTINFFEENTLFQICKHI